MSDQPGALDSEETRQPLPRRLPARAELVVTLTVLCHPNLRRVGERCLLQQLLFGLRVGLSRTAPSFQTPGSVGGRPLEDPYLTRKPLWLSSEGSRVLLDLSEVVGSVRVDGQSASGVLVLEAQRLEHGVLLELAERVLLLLHLTQPEPFQASGGLVGASEAMRRLQREIAEAAAHDLPVLVLGETGSGKELVSRAVHDQSARARGPYVAVSLATIPTHLAEDELFGHVAGAFSGARQARAGLFREAHGGTLFLDELGEASGELQAKLLRVTESRELRQLGSSAAVPVDVRLIAATDADLHAQQRSGQFKSPLWHRLAAAQIRIPPLRARRDDVARLWVHFVAAALDCGASTALEGQQEQQLMSTSLMALLVNHAWPGNVRQLRHTATTFALRAVRSGSEAAAASLFEHLAAESGSRASVLPVTADAAARSTDLEQPPSAQPSPAQAGRRAESIDDAALNAALRDNQWRILAAARQLGISKNALYRLIEQSPTVRKGSQVPADELRTALARCAGDVEDTAAALQISERALRLRMTELGMTHGK